MQYIDVIDNLSTHTTSQSDMWQKQVHALWPSRTVDIWQTITQYIKYKYLI